MTAKYQYFSTSLEKGLRILSLFSEQTPCLTQTQVSRLLNLNMTSTYRFVNTLVQLGYLEKDERTKELRLGFKSLVLGTNILRGTDELRLIKQLADKVHEEHNITIDIGFTVDDTMVRVYRCEAEEILTYRLPAVAVEAMHNTSVGKAYLSTLPDEELDRMIGQIKLKKKTEKTITDPDALRTEIVLTRQRGYAMCDEEYLPGLITIGAPLTNPNTGRGVGAVSFDFSTIQQTLAQVEEKYAGLIVHLGAELSKVLRGRSDD